MSINQGTLVYVVWTSLVLVPNQKLQYIISNVYNFEKSKNYKIRFNRFVQNGLLSDFFFLIRQMQEMF